MLKWYVLLPAGGVLCVLFLVVLIGLPTAAQIAFIGLIGVSVVGFLAPLRALIFAWAAILPIWTIGALDPLIFDGLRAVVGIIIGLRVARDRATVWTPAARRTALALMAAAVCLAIIGFVRPDTMSLNSGATMLMGVTIAWAVLRGLHDPWIVFNGYLLGVVLSASVLIASAFGLTLLTPQADAGLSRQTGLSPSATLVTYQLAVAVVIAWAAYGRRVHRGRYVAVVLISLAALALSGGRGGVVALALAIIVAVRWGWFRVLPFIALVLLGWIALQLALAAGVAVNTLERLIDPDPSGGPEGRFMLLEWGIQSVLQNPLTGVGISAFEAEFGIGTHNAILTFFIGGGVLCGVIILVVTASMPIRFLFISPKPAGTAGKAGHLVLAVLLVTVFTEPSGPFIGVEYTALLLLSITVTARPLRNPSYAPLAVRARS